jgi:hypothetical protein
MIIYIDENMAPILAHGFNLLQSPLNNKFKLEDPIEVKSIKEVFGEGAQDEDWIPIAGGERACIITQDYNIQRIRHQRDLCEKHGLGMFYFRPPSKTGFTYWEMVKLLVNHWEEIIKTASKKSRPFSYKITSKSSGLVSMDD